MSTLNFCERFFKGFGPVLNGLAKVIKGARKHSGLRCKDLDRFCGFGKTINGRTLPSSSQFEKNPNLINSTIFSLCSLALGLKADDVIINRILKRKLTDPEKLEISKFIQDHKLGVQYACGGTERIQYGDQVEAFFALRVLSEIDLK